MFGLRQSFSNGMTKRLNIDQNFICAWLQYSLSYTLSYIAHFSDCWPSNAIQVVIRQKLLLCTWCLLFQYKRKDSTKAGFIASFISIAFIVEFMVIWNITKWPIECISKNGFCVIFQFCCLCSLKIKYTCFLDVSYYPMHLWF